MDERRVRYATGRNGDGTTHRVGLTRHCLASGAVQLPFALRDALPEGELLALDVDRDEAVVLESAPPRRLAGLTAFFEAHELEVNDQLELRIRDGEVRLAAVRRARRVAPADGDDGAARPVASTWTSRLPATEPFGEERAPLERPDVVERFGTVTVRRLGAGTFASPPSQRLPRPEPAAPENATPKAAAPEPSRTELHAPEPHAPEPHAPEMHTLDPQTPEPPTPDARESEAAASEPAVRDASSDARRDAATKRPLSTVGPATPRAATAKPADEANDDRIEDLLVSDSRPGSPATRVGDDTAPPPRTARDEVADGPVEQAVRQESLFGSASQPPRRALQARRAARPPVRAPGRTSATRAPWERAHVPHPLRTRDAQPVREQDLADPDARATPVPDLAARPTAVPEAHDPARDRRAREEELSRAGDLHSRIVRWLLRPDTPVIIGYERVQEEFGLAPDVTRDILAGILEAPPPSLRLTVVRDGMLRIARVTVEQEA